MSEITAVPAGADSWQQIIHAYKTLSWTKLGYRTWAAYMAGEWDLNPVKRFEPAEQAKIAAVLFAAEMPIKDVAAAMGVPLSVGARTRRGRHPEMKQQPEGQSYVYLIGSDGFRPVKIGTGNPSKRLGELQIGNPFPLKILWQTPGGAVLETALHHRFNMWRHSGEWFDFPDGVDPVTTVSRMAEALIPMVGTSV